MEKLRVKKFLHYFSLEEGVLFIGLLQLVTNVWCTTVSMILLLLDKTGHFEIDYEEFINAGIMLLEICLSLILIFPVLKEHQMEVLVWVTSSSFLFLAKFLLLALHMSMSAGHYIFETNLTRWTAVAVYLVWHGYCIVVVNSYYRNKFICVAYEEAV